MTTPMRTKLKRPQIRRERSAGILLFQENPRRYLVLFKQKTTDFPRGKIAPGETEEQAARRETREETGIAQVDLVPGFRQVTRFVFGKGAGKTFKTITYFLGCTTQADVVLSKEHKGFAWLPPAEAMARVRFKNQRATLEQAEAFLAEKRP